MKNDLQSNPALFKIVILFTCFMLVLLYNKSKAANLVPSTFKKLSISFKQDLRKNEVSIFTNASSGKTIELRFYSARKKIIEKVSINSGKETVVKDFKKGTYLYECFDNNLRIQSGTIVLE